MRFVLVAALMLPVRAQPAQPGLVLVKTVELPAVEGPSDRLAFDSGRGHLCLAARGSSRIVPCCGASAIPPGTESSAR